MRTAIDNPTTNDLNPSNPPGQGFPWPRNLARTRLPPPGLAAAAGVGLCILATLASHANAQPAQPFPPPSATATPVPDDRPPPPSTVRVGPDGVAVESPDRAFVLKIRGYLQGDARFYLDAGVTDPPHTFLTRRARPTVEVTLLRHFGFRLTPELAGSAATIQDAYLDARPLPTLSLRAGKLKQPFGLERLASATNTLFVELAFPTLLAPNRDIGVQVHGQAWDGALTYAIGVFNGVADGDSSDRDTDKGKDIVGRVFAHPLRPLGVAALHHLGVGLAASFGRAHGTLAAPGLSSFRTSGQQTFFRYLAGDSIDTTAITAGDRSRVSPQAYYFFDHVGLIGEYVASSQEVAVGASRARLTHHAWQAAATFVLGGTASYQGVRPSRGVGEGGLGAFELAGRYHALRLDPDTFPSFADPARAARRARGVTVGAGWWANPHVRVMADFDHTAFTAGASGGGNRRPESAVLLRTQISW